jgi:glucose-6-phosphate isomerase
MGMPVHETLLERRTASRLWSRDLSVFGRATTPDVSDAIRNRLGWLDAPTRMRDRLADVAAVAREVRSDNLTHLCVLGMGGSSLCAEVLRQTLAPPDTRDQIVVLDTTDERAVRDAASILPSHSTLFVVASKSGTTVEVTALESFFRAWVHAGGNTAPGRQFVAITDPDTALVRHAAAHQYRHTFVNPADIGGRFSALSLFGLVPAALMGIAPESLLDAAAPMVEACHQDDLDNPGLALGAFMAEQALLGRDKLTILLPESLTPLGLWIEQLVAESTGKHDRGVLPIVDEPAPGPGGMDGYGPDRAFVLTSLPLDDEAVAHERALVASHHPVFHMHSTTRDLGAEFFRWEFATAVAGIALDVNPFDEPNVRDAKSRTTALLASDGALPVEPPLTARHGVLGRSHRPEGVDAAHGFVALLDYLPQDAARAEVVTRLRTMIRTRTNAATTYGMGPRYLHSTGQFHKGGTNAGLFLLFTGADATDTPVPGESYSFSRLKHAQALGDFAALVANGRHVVHFHVDDPTADFSAELERLVTEALLAQ